MAFFGAGEPYSVQSEGEQTNPADETVLADTGALAAGHYYGFATCVADAASQCRLERRNAANDAAVGDAILIYVPADDMRQIAWGFTVEASERIRIVMDDAQAAGVVSASLNWTRQV